MAGLARFALVGAFFLNLMGVAAEAGDLSILSKWAGKFPFDEIIGGKALWDQPPVQEAMLAAMGPKYYGLARKTVLKGPQAPVSANGKGTFVAWSCKAHDCGDNQINVFFDSVSGTAQVCLRMSDRSGKVQDLWLANGKARPLPREACQSKESDPFGPLKKFGAKA
jgi:hypothetical protein